MKGTGAGTVELNGSSYTAASTGATFDFAPGELRFLQGQFNGGTAGFTNAGDFDLDQSGVISRFSGVFNNVGTFEISGVSAFELNSDATFTNLAGALVDFQGDGSLIVGNTSRTTFYNQGTLRKSAGTLTGIDAAGFDTAGGTIDVETGTIDLDSSGSRHGGTFDVAAGAVLDVSAGTSTGTFTGSGAGSVTITNATIGAAGATFDFDPGLLQWAGSIDATLGTLTNIEAITIACGSLGGTLNNQGTLTQTSGSLDLDINGGTGGTLNNAGLYDIQDDSGTVSNAGDGSAIHNTGTLRKSAGTGTSTVDPDTFTSPGSVSASSGTLAIAAGSDAELTGQTLHDGTWLVSQGAKLDLGGAIQTNDATITIDGTGSMLGNLTGLSANDGSLSLTGGATLATVGDLINNGTVTLGASSSLDVAGTFTQTAAGTLDVVVGGAAASGQVGTLTAAGAAMLDGTLSVQLANGYGPAVGTMIPVVSFAGETGSFATFNGPTSGGTPVFRAVTSATAVTLNAIAQGADLAATTVTYSGAPATPGQPTSVSFTVTNAGGAAASGTWEDSVYLSAAGTFDPNAVLLGRVTHTGGLAAGASYTATLTAALPALAEGTYKLFVLADSGKAVADRDRTDNLAAAATPLVATVPVLALGTTATLSVASGEDVYYKVVGKPGDDVTIKALSASAGDAQIYVGDGTLPTPFSFGQTTGSSATSQSLMVTGEVSGTLYVLVHGLAAAGAGASVTLAAAISPLSITGLVASKGVTNETGAVIGLQGTQFTPATTVSLVAANGTSYDAKGITYLYADALAGTFDLSAIPAGTYTVVAKDGASSASAPTPYTVVPFSVSTDVSQLVVSITSPGEVIANQVLPFPVSVTFQNPTGTPILINEFDIIGKAATFPYLPPLSVVTDNMGEQIETAQLISPGASVLVPTGGKYSIVAQAYPNPTFIGTHAVFSGEFVGANDGPLDLTALSAALKPPSISQDAWNAIFQNLSAAIGTTTYSLGDLEKNDDVFLQLATGSATPPTSSDALELEIVKASDALPTPVLDAATDVSYPAPGLSLTFARSFQSSIEGRYNDGRLGQGWVDNWDYAASFDPSSAEVTIREGAITRAFTANANGTFTAAAGDAGVLTELGGAYHLAEADGSFTAFNPDGTLNLVQDADGNRITAGYAGGLMTSLTSSDGEALTIGYNGQGKIASVTDPTGRVASYAYDATGRELTGVTTVSGTSTYAYGAATTGPTAFELTSITDPGGTGVTFAYDSQGRLAGEANNGGVNPLTYSYGANSYTVTDADGNATTSFFDQNGAVTVVLDPLGHVSTAAYNGVGQVTSLGEVGGGASKISYGVTKSGGATTTTTDPTGGKVTLTYTSDYGELTASTDQDGNVTSYGRDAKGNLISITYADGSKTSYSYAPDGSVTQSVDRNGVASTYTYDSRGLLLSQTLSDGTTSSYTYDSHGNRLTATDASGTIVMVYDGADRLTRITYADGRFLSYTYDAGGRRLSSTDQDGFTTLNSYDAQGRLAELTEGSGALIARYTYDAVGNLVRQDNGNGTTTTTSYDADSAVLDIVNHASNGSVNSRFDYAYDALGRVATMTTLAGIATYSYDADSRLIGAKLADGTTIAYSYDAAGNRTDVVTDGQAIRYTTNDLNEYATVGGTVQSYDAAGDLTSDGGGDTYTYNDLGRLASVTNASGTYTYQYDALGNRSSETYNGLTTTFLVDPTGIGNVVAEYDATGKLIASYTYGNGLTSQISSSGANYYDFDALGSTAGLSGVAGVYIASYTYDPFGNVLSSMGIVTNPFKYNGEFGIQTDDSGLDYMRARDYSPTTGRFTQPDPTGLAGGFNAYSFVTNNPTGFLDPTGQFGLKDIDAAGIASTLSYVSAGTAQQSNLGNFSRGVSLGVAIEATAEVAFGSNQDLDENLDRALSAYESVAVSQYYSALRSEVTAALIENIGGASVAAEFGSLISLPASLSIAAIQFEAKFLLKQVPLLVEDVYGLYFPTITYATTVTDVVGPAHDPNSISGPAGYGSNQFITGGGTDPYYLSFTNEATAGSPARTVTITQQLDPNLDLSTFQLGAFGFGDQVVNVPAGLRNYETRVDDRAATGDFVDVAIHLDTATRTLTATFTSIDPSTLDTESDVLAGFLPPDRIEPEGTGFLTYTVAPYAGLASGTTIAAQGSVVFDTQDPIATNVFINTLDNDAPTSAVAALPRIVTSNAIPLSWSGSDGAGSGIASYSIYVATDGGSYVPFLQATTAMAAVFQGEAGHEYSFYSIATDNVGFVQDPPATADTTTYVDTSPVALAVSGTVNEHGAPITLTAAYSDPDAGDTHGFAVDTTGTRGRVTSNGEGTFSYDPNGAFAALPAGATATDSFAYTVTDAAGLSSTASATLTVIGQDDAPVAAAIADSVTEHGPAVILAASYSDPDAGDTHGFAVDTTGTKGRVTSNGDGTFSYDPDGAFAALPAGATATDSFAYTVTDAAGLSSTASATLTITGQDDAPAPAAIADSVTEHGPAVTLSASYSDSDAGDCHSFAVDTAGTRGRVASNGDGTFTYDPDGAFAALPAGATASDSFAYTVTDAAGLASTASATLTIIGQDEVQSDTLTLRVSADSYLGDPQFTVAVDGVQVGGVQTASASHAAGQFQDITLTGAFGPDPKQVAVTFLNDAFDGTPATDRNLYVQSATLNGKTYLGASASIPFGDAPADGGGAAGLYVDSSLAFTLAQADTPSVSDPQFTVAEGGVTIGGVQTASASHAAGQFQDITLTGAVGPDPKQVTVALDDAGDEASDPGSGTPRILFKTHSDFILADAQFLQQPWQVGFVGELAQTEAVARNQALRIMCPTA